MLISLRSLTGTNPAPTWPITGTEESRKPVTASTAKIPTSLMPVPRTTPSRPSSGFCRIQKTAKRPASITSAASAPLAGIVSADTKLASARPTIINRWSSAQAIRSLYRSAIRSNHLLNRSSVRATKFRRSCASVCGSAQ